MTRRVKKLVEATGMLYAFGFDAYGDRKLREVAMNSGLKRAFEVRGLEPIGVDGRE